MMKQLFPITWIIFFIVRLKYWREEDDEIMAQIRLNNGTEPTGLVVGLVPNTFYWVRVMAYNSAGSGPESEKFRGNIESK